jgi:hypothetical protein
MSSDHSFGLDADPPYQPNGRSDEQGVPSNAVKQDKGARVFAVIAILLFVCYFIGALTANAQEKSAVAKHGTEQPAVGSSCRCTLRLLQVDEYPTGCFQGHSRPMVDEPGCAGFRVESRTRPFSLP